MLGGPWTFDVQVSVPCHPMYQAYQKWCSSLSPPHTLRAPPLMSGAAGSGKREAVSEAMWLFSRTMTCPASALNDEASGRSLVPF